MAQDEMVREHHQLNGHEYEQTLGVLQFMGWQRVEQGLATDQQQHSHLPGDQTVSMLSFGI